MRALSSHVLAPGADIADAELIARVQADDANAFEDLFDRFAPKAYGLALMLARDPARAEDVIQDAFMAIWRTRATYRADRGAVSVWIMSIVHNRAIDALRRDARHDRRRADEDRVAEGLNLARDTDDRVAEREDAAYLRELLARLPDAQREVIALAYFGELSSSEIAHELSLPLGTIKGRMRLGLEKLRGDMPPQG